MIDNLFWPTYVSSIPSGVCRFGRVLHWAATLIAALLVPLVIIGFFFANDQSMGWIFLIISFAVFMIGRALRYIFSCE